MASYTRFTRTLLSKPSTRKFSASSALRTSSDKSPRTSWESLLSGRIAQLEKTTDTLATKAEVQEVQSEASDMTTVLCAIGMGCFVTFGACLAKSEFWDLPGFEKAMQRQKADHQGFIEREVRKQVREHEGLLRLIAQSEVQKHCWKTR